MSLASDLAAMYADTFFTVPVELGTSSTRGFFDESRVLESTEGPMVQVRVTALRVITGSLPDLADDAEITINGTPWRVRQFAPVDDGLETEILVAR